ncbi:hypothetical protein EJ110_NYTH05948 [Nymphaea thermarum]|nr:hypothetical protein EJ110_NYTH05948 [Nymphaea thermarum]
MWRPRLSRLLPSRSLHNPRDRTPPVVEGRSMDPRSGPRRHADFRICSVSGFKTEVLELRARNPSVCVLVIPGNPGVVSFYKDFVEAIYEMLDENASVIGDYEQRLDILAILKRTGKEEGCLLSRIKSNISSFIFLFILFSLPDRLCKSRDSKYQNSDSVGRFMFEVGHSIGAYISLQIFKQIPSQVQFTIGLYPFLSLNKKSLQQSIIRIITSIGINSKLCIQGSRQNKYGQAMVYYSC